MIAEVHLIVEIICEGVQCREHVPTVAVCRWWRRQPLGGKRRRSGGIQVRAEDGRLVIVRLATGTKAQHHERTPRRGLLAVSVLLHPCVAAGRQGRSGAQVRFPRRPAADRPRYPGTRRAVRRTCARTCRSPRTVAGRRRSSVAAA